MNNKEKKFDAVKWVREIRDKFYEEHKHLNMEEYLLAHKKEAEKFHLKLKTKSLRSPAKNAGNKSKKTKSVI